MSTRLKKKQGRFSFRVHCMLKPTRDSSPKYALKLSISQRHSHVKGVRMLVVFSSGVNYGVWYHLRIFLPARYRLELYAKKEKRCQEGVVIYTNQKENL